MNQFNYHKTIQLIFYIGVTLVLGLTLFPDSSLMQMIADNSSLRLFFWIIWIILAYSFIAMFIDFHMMTRLKRDIDRLEQLVYGDSMAGGIPNRFSCDTLLQKYANIPAPKNIGCIMIDLTNLMETNKKHGHIIGNELIKAFSSILESSGVSLCFVGRNNGNKFLAIFEECTPQKIDAFLKRVHDKVNIYNQEHPSLKIQYAVGSAVNMEEQLEVLTDLVALANRRIQNV